MKSFRQALLITVMIAPAAWAAPDIASISPTSGPVAGGIEVTVRGTGFAPDADVFFGGTPARSVRFVDATTLLAVTPPLLPREMFVAVRQTDGSSSLPTAFTPIGKPEDGFEPLLVPIYGPPARGAFGSEFHTTILGASDGDRPVVRIYGINTTCYLSSPVLDPYLHPITLTSSEPSTQLPIACSAPARILWLPAEQAQAIALGARVTDVTRTDERLGVEIPVLRRSDMTEATLAILGVPTDPRYRTALRIYSIDRDAASAVVAIDGEERTVALRSAGELYPGIRLFEDGDFDPFYAFVSDLRHERASAADRFDVRVRAFDAAGAPARVWAFVTITNNDTQQITIITPH